MPRGVLYLLVALVLGILVFGPQTSLGQNDESASEAPETSGAEENEEPATPATPEPPVAEPIEVSPLDMFWFRDSKGNLVPVWGMTFEKLEELRKLEKGLAPPAPPAYSLDALTIAGSVEKNLANLEVTASIRVRDSGWVRVPLRFNQGVLRQTTTYEGPGEHFVEYNEQDGYVCWLIGAGDKPHLVKLNMSLPIRSLGAQSRIETIFPRATESSLKLVVPLAKAEAELTAMGEGLVSTQPSGTNTEIEVLGAGGEVSLIWRPGQTMAGGKTLLEAGGEINVKVEGRYRVSSEARLLVKSLSGPLETFHVRLPPGMELIPTNPTGYTVTPVEPMPGAAAGTDEAELVEIKLDRPTTSVAEIRLLTALQTRADEPNSNPKSGLQPAQFEVISAVRQRGTIDFTIDGDWSVSWTQDSATRRVEAPAASGASKGSTARFEYFKQPCGLAMSIEPRPTRIAVEPTYVIYIEPKVMRLEATWKYRVRGAAAQSLAVSLGDWVFAKVEPETIVEVESLDPTAQTLVLPLRTSTIAGEFEIRLEAHRLLPEGSTDVTFSLPRPTADIITPANVIVVPSDNVELTPKARDITGLVSDSQPPAISLPARQQSPLVFRDRGVGGEAKFVGQLQVRTRQTTVAAAARLQFSKRTLQIEQKLKYRILYEPQRHFRLQVPRSLLAGDLKVMLGAEALGIVPLADSDSESSRLARVQVTTPTEQIGPCELTVQYTVPVPSVKADEPTTMAVPLVIPDEEVDQVGLGQTLSAQWNDGLQVQLAPSGRATDIEPLVEASSINELRASSSGLSADWRFQLRTSDPANSSRLTIAKMWLQTLLLEDVRQERAVWRVSTGSSGLRIGLPPRAKVDSDQVAIDGRRATARREGDVLVVPLSPSSDERVVEVWYSIPRRSSGVASTLAELSPPTIEGAGQARQCYWQVCLPGREHLLVEPGGFTPELAWVWRGSYWDRRGTLDQTALEEWIQASPQRTLPNDMNVYLFSTFRSPTAMSLLVLPRSVILWTIGGVVLVLGLLFLNMRAVRRPSIVLVLAVALAAAGLSWPTSALVLGQAAVVALLVIALAALWQWSVTGQTPYGTAAAPPSSAQVEQKSTATMPAARSEPGPMTTATTPLAAMTEPQP